jgi:membrane protein DedA with SNARE-associated domain
MYEFFTHHLGYYFAHYGLWTVFFGVMLENAGIPLPGETILILASMMAAHQHLNIFHVAAVALLGAVIGDNLGYAAGRYGGRKLLTRYHTLLRIKPETIEKAEQLFRKRGGFTVFIGRFVAGLRFLAGPLAGVLAMEWKRFFFFNVLGAVAWVGIFTTLAYFFGHAFKHYAEYFTWIVAGSAVIAVIVWLVKKKFAKD